MSHTDQPDPEPCAPCFNPGNPVFSCMLGAAVKPVYPLYRTTSSQYGSRAPTYELAPCVYYPMSQKFSTLMGLCGMPQDTSFNTSLDRSRVFDCPNLQNTL